MPRKLPNSFACTPGSSRNSSRKSKVKSEEASVTKPPESELSHSILQEVGENASPWIQKKKKRRRKPLEMEAIPEDRTQPAKRRCTGLEMLRISDEELVAQCREALEQAGIEFVTPSQGFKVERASSDKIMHQEKQVVENASDSMPTSKPKPSPLEKSASPTKSELDEKSLPDSPKSPNFTVQAEKAKRSPSPPPDPRSLKAFFARFNMGRGNVLDQVHTKETSEKEGSGDEMLDALLADDFDDD